MAGMRLFGVLSTILDIYLSEEEMGRNLQGRVSVLDVGGGIYMGDFLGYIG